MRAWAKAKSLVRGLAGDRRRRALVLGSAVVLVATLAAIFVSRQVSIAGLRREIARLEREQTEAAARQKELRSDVASTSDPQTLAEEARRRLGLVAPGEEKVFFVEEESP